MGQMHSAVAAHTCPRYWSLLVATSHIGSVMTVAARILRVAHVSDAPCVSGQQCVGAYRLSDSTRAITNIRVYVSVPVHVCGAAIDRHLHGQIRQGAARLVLRAMAGQVDQARYKRGRCALALTMQLVHFVQRSGTSASLVNLAFGPTENVRARTARKQPGVVRSSSTPSLPKARSAALTSSAFALGASGSTTGGLSASAGQAREPAEVMMMRPSCTAAWSS
jgi:hypothetical protein